MHEVKPQNIKLGVSLALIASLSYTLMNVFVKLLGEGFSTTTVVFSRFAIGLVILLPWFLTDKNLFKFDHIFKILLRCITSILAIVFLFYSLKYIPVTDVVLLNNTFPLFLPILSLLLLRIKTSMKVTTGIIIGFIGVAIILNPHANTFNWHAWIALLSGLFIALGMLQIRLLTRSSSSKQIVFTLFAFGTIASGLFIPFSFKTPTTNQLILLFIVGFFGAFYQILLTKALEFAKARIVSPIYFSSILFAALLDWIIWSKKLNLTDIVGMFLIIAGGFVTILMAQKEKHQ